MFFTLLENAIARSLGLAHSQSRQCGVRYVFRKYLAIVLQRSHREHVAVAHSLALPHTQALVQHHPKAAFKYLHRYLARAFSIRERAAILANHYRYLDGRVQPDFIGRLCRGRVTLWNEEIDGRRYGIALTYPANEEGELFLMLLEEDAVIYTLSFTIAPGGLLDLPDGQVAFIGRLQGVANEWEAIRRATRALQDVAPALLLLDAVRSIALSLGLSGIVGVSAQNQVCMRGRRRRAATTSYDEFWMSADASRMNELGYYLPALPQEKPLSEIPNKHRSRVKRKRHFRSAVAQQVGVAFEGQCLSPHPRPPAPLASEITIGNYCGTLPAMNDLSFATSASITSQR